MFNNLFDEFNSKDETSPSNLHKTPYSGQHMEFLNEMLSFIETMNICTITDCIKANCTKTTKTDCSEVHYETSNQLRFPRGWRVSINALKGLWSDVGAPRSKEILLQL